MSLYSDAADGLLSPLKLKAYGYQHVNDIDTKTGLTPLIAAINGGHIKIVQLLLDNGADANKNSRDNRTPLFFATWKKGTEHRSEIVSALIAGKAEVDGTSLTVQNITPLMNAIGKLRDPEVVSLLVDAGASTIAKNRRGQTAKGLAEKVGDPQLSKALRPKLERYAPTAETVNMLVSIVLFVVAWINIKSLEGVAQGVAKRVFKMTGATNPVLDDAVGGSTEPKTKEEFQDKINDWIVDSKLGRVFDLDDNYLATLADKALKLKDTDPNFLGRSENLDKLVRLSLYKTIIFCGMPLILPHAKKFDERKDDSRSMGSPTNSKSYAKSQMELVSRMARICTKIVPDNEGVDLFYIHSDGAADAGEKKIREAMMQMRNSPGTPIGTKLKQKILESFVYSVINSSDKKFQRPILITIITDGAPSDEEDDNDKAMEEAILTCIDTLKNNGYPEYAVIFQVSKIGDDEGAKTFLQALARRAETLKSLYCTDGKLDDRLKEKEEHLERWLFKLLTSPIERALSGNE